MITSSKAKEILEDGTVHGKKLTDKQKRFMHARASGKKRKKFLKPIKNSEFGKY